MWEVLCLAFAAGFALGMYGLHRDAPLLVTIAGIVLLVLAPMWGTAEVVVVNNGVVQVFEIPSLWPMMYVTLMFSLLFMFLGVFRLWLTLAKRRRFF